MVLQAVFSRPASDCARVLGRPYVKIRMWKEAASSLKGGGSYRAEFYTDTQVFHKTLDATEFEAFLAEHEGTTFRTVVERTEDMEITVMANRHGKIRRIQKPLNAKNTARFGAKEKNYLLPPGTPVPFMVRLGLMSADGKVIAQKYDKFRQINRFLEFIQDTLDAMHCGDGGEGGDFSPERPLRILDFGCGKSYLTFAVYHYLSEVKHIPVHITGLDLKKDVIEFCSSLAGELNYGGLEFRVGDVADFADGDGADIVICLHACDTATDYALNYAVRNSARAILCVPCCQHEINSQVGSGKKFADDSAFASLMRHGIIRERLCALATDALRAECLEQHGYGVQVLEFIDMEHTPKNLLIRAVKKTATGQNARVAQEAAEEKSRLRSGALLGELGASQTLCRLLED